MGVIKLLYRLIGNFLIAYGLFIIYYLLFIIYPPICFIFLGVLCSLMAMRICDR